MQALFHRGAFAFRRPRFFGRAGAARDLLRFEL